MQDPVRKQSLSFFVGRAKWIQAGVVLFPFVAGMFPEKPAYLAPPLGAMSDLVAPLALIVVGIFAIMPWFLRPRRIAVGSVLLSTATCICCFIIYSLAVSSTVVKLEAFNPLRVARVSIGTQRLPFADKNYGDKSDIEMVKEFGHREEDIQQLWTKESITSSRMKLLLSYLGFFASANFALGAFAKASILQELETQAARRPTKKPTPSP